jgi:hypothetical protein
MKRSAPIARKQRTRRVILDAGDIVVSASSGPIIRPVSVSLEESYERPKGAKVTARVPLSGKDIPPSLDHLLARYDYLIAIDTNTQHIGDDFVSATGVVSGRQVSGSSNRHLVFRIRCPLRRILGCSGGPGSGADRMVGSSR